MCITELWTELTATFKEHQIYVKKWLKKNYGYSQLGNCRHSVKNEQSEPLTSKKTSDKICYKLLQI